MPRGAAPSICNRFIAVSRGRLNGHGRLNAHGLLNIISTAGRRPDGVRDRGARQCREHDEMTQSTHTTAEECGGSISLPPIVCLALGLLSIAGMHSQGPPGPAGTGQARDTGWASQPNSHRDLQV